MTDQAQTRNGWLGRAISSRSALVGQSGWVGIIFGIQQGIRLVTNIILSRMLAPELFGTMMLLTTFRVGVELLSDIGIGQNIVRHEKGEDQEFLNTAWVLQIARGLLLFAVTLAITIPATRIYHDQQLQVLLPLMGLLVLMLGLKAPSRYILEKRLQLRRVAKLEAVLGVISAVFHIALALYTPTIWALVFGLLLMGPVEIIASFLLMPGAKWRLQVNRQYASDMLHFGKWIFVATAIYFLSMNYDRLFFAKAMPAVMLGIYGIARSYSDTVVLLFNRLANLVIFPRIAASGQRGNALQQSVAKTRFSALSLIAVGLAFAVVVADLAVHTVYDQRYHLVGVLLPLFLVGVWFTVLATFADGMLYGVGNSRSVALSNAAKLGWIAAMLPLMMNRFDIRIALVVFVFGDAVRYCILAWQKRKAGISFLRQDVVLTLLFLVTAVLLRLLTGALHLTSGVSGWLGYWNDIHG